MVREAAQGNLDGLLVVRPKSFPVCQPSPAEGVTEFTDNYGEAGKSDVAIAVNNAIAGTPWSGGRSYHCQRTCQGHVNVYSGFHQRPESALENAQGLQEILLLALLGRALALLPISPSRRFRYQMGTALDELETARSKLNAAMRPRMPVRN